MELLLKEIIEKTGGELVQGNVNNLVGPISTDSRTIKRGETFVALKGEKFDGNKFIGVAIEKGASGVIASDKEIVAQLKEKKHNIWLVCVDDTLKALGDIAALWLQKVAPEKVVVIAGSAGKTTTKEMIATGLAGVEEVLVSPENFNNLIGVPLNLLRLERTHRIMVQEIGMNEAGELRRLMQILQPNVAVIVNIGTAHIGKLGGEKALLQAKGEVLDELKSDALLIYNADCGMTHKLLTEKKLPEKIESFGIDIQADYTATEVKLIEPWGYRFILNIKGKSAPAEIHLFGKHNIYNALCATAVLHNLGKSINEITDSLRSFKPFNLRSEIEEVHGIYLVKDCYNSSPDAVISAIQSLVEINRHYKTKQKRSRSIAVLGDMLELGSMTNQFHQAIGKYCVDAGVDTVIAVGNSARLIAKTVTEYDGTAYYFHSPDETAEFLSDFLQPGDFVLIKASRLMQFERIIAGFKHALVNSNMGVGV